MSCSILNWKKRAADAMGMDKLACSEDVLSNEIIRKYFARLCTKNSGYDGEGCSYKSLRLQQKLRKK